MASRRRAREFALQALYRADVGKDSAMEALSALWAAQMDEMVPGRPGEGEEITFAERLCRGVEERVGELDTLIETASANWRVERMPVIDRSILRMATYELLACQDVPATVTINEAIELAKRFGEKQSKAFVNGILDRVASDLGRGGRRQKKR